MKRTENISSLIEIYSKRKQDLRRSLIDIVTYSEGMYHINDLVQMPRYYINDILESIKEKNERHKQAVESASGKNKRTF
jgi:hypothetical protein